MHHRHSRWTARSVKTEQIKTSRLEENTEIKAHSCRVRRSTYNDNDAILCVQTLMICTAVIRSPDYEYFDAVDSKAYAIFTA